MATRTEAVDIDHRRFDEFEPLGLERNALALGRTDRRQAPRARILKRTNHPRWSNGSISRQGRGGMRQLQDCERVVTLPDSDRNRLTRQPPLLVTTQLPGARWQDSLHLSFEINSGQLTKAPGLHEIVDGIHAHVVGDHVVIGIRGHDNRAMQIDGTISPGVGVTKFVAAKLKVPRIVDRGAGRALATLKRCQCHEWFVSRARWVGTAQRPVEQRLVGRLVIALPNLRINAVGKEIWIEGGFTDKGQNLSRSWIDCDKRSPPITKHVFDQLLQAQID